MGGIACEAGRNTCDAGVIQWANVVSVRTGQTVAMEVEVKIGDAVVERQTSSAVVHEYGAGGAGALAGLTGGESLVETVGTVEVTSFVVDIIGRVALQTASGVTLNTVFIARQTLVDQGVDISANEAGSIA